MIPKRRNLISLIFLVNCKTLYVKILTFASMNINQTNSSRISTERFSIKCHKTKTGSKPAN